MYRNLFLIFILFLPCTLFAASDSEIKHAQRIIAPPRLMKNGMMQSPHAVRDSRSKNSPVKHYNQPVLMPTEDRLMLERERMRGLLVFGKTFEQFGQSCTDADADTVSDMPPSPKRVAVQIRPAHTHAYCVPPIRPIPSVQVFKQQPQISPGNRVTCYNYSHFYGSAHVSLLTHAFSRTLIRVSARII